MAIDSRRMTCSTIFGSGAIFGSGTLAPDPVYGIGVIGGWPLRTFTTFRATRSYIAARVSAVALAMCGTSTTFSSASRPGCTSGFVFVDVEPRTFDDPFAQRPRQPVLVDDRAREMC